MKEQSHKDEMAAALRGDFERLRERGVAATLGPVEPPVEPERVEPVPLEPEPVQPEPIALEPEEPPEEPSAAADEPAARPGLLGRLFGR